MSALDQPLKKLLIGTKCAKCKKNLSVPAAIVGKCNQCSKPFCSNHRHQESHQCGSKPTKKVFMTLEMVREALLAQYGQSPRVERFLTRAVEEIEAEKQKKLADGLSRGLTVGISPINMGRVLEVAQDLMNYTRPWMTLTGHTKDVTCCAISPDGTWILSGDGNWMYGDPGRLKIWDATSATCIKTVTGAGSGRISDCAISPDGKWFVSASQEKLTQKQTDFPTGVLKIWDATNGKRKHILRGHSSATRCCAFSPDGTWVLSGSVDNTLKRWDVNSGACIQTLKAASTFNVTCCAISPDGTWVVQGSRDKRLQIWNVNDGVITTTLQGHTDWVNCCASFPFKEWVLSGSNDNTLKIWNVVSGECIQTLEGHNGNVYCCASFPFEEGRKWVLSGSGDKTLKIWNAVSGECLRTLETGIYVHCCAISGDWVLSGGSDRTLQVWDRKYINF